MGPIALLLAATLAVVLIHNARHGGHHSTVTSGTSTTTQTVAKPRLYTVRPGDTLASIAAKTGVRAARLLTLNPNLQPTSLFIGERIRLR